ncbi:MAG TPA: GNAT family N-acetyltransferase [Ignavibacteriaceae bacterium]|nr:GNAT family N-acetyltransferase [Ignavibacteriaceae bacterium]
MQNVKNDPGGSFIFRKAENEDRFEVFKLVETVLAGYGLSMDPEGTDKDLLNLDESYLKNGGWFEVIVDPRKKIIGSYGLFKIDNDSCELRKMYLYPEFQGLGLGKKMLNKAVLKAKELGFKEIILETNKLLNQAIGLYKKYGFVEFNSDHLSERCNLAMKLIL